jgi:hypothetical protein
MKGIHDSRNKHRRKIERPRTETQLDKELRFHIEQQGADNVAAEIPRKKLAVAPSSNPASRVSKKKSATPAGKPTLTI